MARARLRMLADGALSIVGEAADLRQARTAGREADAFLVAPAVDLADDASAEALTPREIEVLELLAEGLSNKGIALRLGISDQTVKFHVASISGKLGAHSRTGAVRLAVRRGLITL
ncbi:MAG: response regulator transcription factor [Vicinamibacteria bacterium]